MAPRRGTTPGVDSRDNFGWMVESAFRQVTVTRHQSSLGRWEYATAQPTARLRPFAREYVGWEESLAMPLCRRELPTEVAPLIINFGAPFHLFAPGSERRASDVRSFITGAYDTYQIVESAGPSAGVQVNLTLLGMRLLVGRPIEDMTNRAVALEDVFGALAGELTERLHEAPSWDARFDSLDMALVARTQLARGIPPPVRHAWRRIVSTAGRVRMDAIVDEVGWSQRHFIAQFRQELGVSPKVFARMLRFGLVVKALRTRPQADLSDIALDAGYYDQAHLHRDTREFAGTTPGKLLASLLPDRGGFAA